MAVSNLTILNALLPKDEGVMRAARAVAYGPDPRQKLDIYVPSAASRSAPVLIFIYGGAWSWGERRDYSFVGHAFAAHGMVAVIPDYRVLPEVAYPRFIEDNAEAARWVVQNIARFGGDVRAIHLAGHSSGAYNAAMLALDPRHDMAGRIAGVIGLAGPYDFLPLDNPTTRRVFGQVTDLEATQPINHVTPAAPPMFLATGAADRTVYPRNTASLARRLRAAGATVTERSYRGVGHAGLLLALSRPFRHRAPVLAEIVDFLGGRRGTAAGSAGVLRVLSDNPLHSGAAD
jgi:acetyl esterase/lipase